MPNDSKTPPRMPGPEDLEPTAENRQKGTSSSQVEPQTGRRNENVEYPGDTGRAATDNQPVENSAEGAEEGNVEVDPDDALIGSAGDECVFEHDDDQGCAKTADANAVDGNKARQDEREGRARGNRQDEARNPQHADDPDSDDYANVSE